ncbi:MAG: peptidylprolyl isomerase [Ruminococcaceae bacterium]|nr:peptidylprolyl isomerase [Oscillospiraceae bacterium]
MKIKRILKTVLLSTLTLCCGFSLACCSGDAGDTNTTTDATTQAASVSEVEVVRPEPNPSLKKDTVNKVGYQLEMPKEGDTIAILHTSMGDITWRFFPENAPKAVESFITLAKEGKYDNTIFHRVYKDFMIQGGDYEKHNGTGGKSAFGSAFEDEFSDTLYNIRGSVAMANSGLNTNGSQFFINQAGADKFNSAYVTDFDTAYKSLAAEFEQAAAEDPTLKATYPTLEDYLKVYTQVYGAYPISPLSYMVTDEVMALYEANGGNMHLDGALRALGGHTVFAQVIEGMDVVDAIADVEVVDNGSGEISKPAKDVILESVEITTYKAD